MMGEQSPQGEVQHETESQSSSIRIEKVVVNIGVGVSGERLEKAKMVLKKITGSNPCERLALDTVREFNVSKSEPIAAMVTLRSRRADEFLRTAFKAVGEKLKLSSFSGRTFSFGIAEHITIPGIKYDPAVGIFGMDVCVVLERQGYRVSKRRRRASKVGRGHAITSQDSINFVKGRFGVEVF